MDMMTDMERKKCRGLVHIVASGDTLYRISKKYDVRLADIMKANPYINVYNLQIGDEICVPTSPMEKPIPVVPLPPKEKTYTVEAGDTLMDVLKEFDTDYMTLAGWNEDLANLPLQPGMVIRMPLAPQDPVIMPRDEQREES